MLTLIWAKSVLVRGKHMYVFRYQIRAQSELTGVEDSMFQGC